VHLSPVWIAPLIAGAVGAVTLVVTAAVLRKEVAELQRSMRPLRVKDRPQVNPDAERTP
jgi:hypothetical protein